MIEKEGATAGCSSWKTTVFFLDRGVSSSGLLRFLIAEPGIVVACQSVICDHFEIAVKSPTRARHLEMGLSWRLFFLPVEGTDNPSPP